MKKRMLIATMGTLLSINVAQARQTVMLEEDMGCDTVEVQKIRVQLTRIVMTTDNEQAKDEATRKLVDVTRRHCVPLTGIFTIAGKVSGLLKVIDKEGKELWLVE